jgi:4,5-DOPA dioxygenase extradiol
MPSARLLLTSLLLGIATALLASLYLRPEVFHNLSFHHTTEHTNLTTAATTLPNSVNTTMPRTPIYFLSHGGPNLFEDYTHPAYAKLQSIGLEITQKVKPKAVVVFSAHWQGDRNSVDVNTATSQGLIYDYYGFPPHYYEVKYPNAGSPELAEKVLEKLKTAGIQGEGVRRGLDHGVFSPFLVAFDPVKNPLNVPVVQVSLFDTENANQHYALGAALSSLRDEGVLIICSGMAVHNLRDFRLTFGKPGSLPYATAFDDALKDAVETVPEHREEVMADLIKMPLARKAHPSFEHLLPIHVAAGAAGKDVGRRLWTLPEGSMSWAQYRFGEVEAAH